MIKKNKGLSKKHALRATSLFQKAFNFHQSGYLEQAEELYHSVLAINPAHFEAMYFLGVIAYQTDKNNLALSFFNRATVIKPDNAEIHNNFALALLKAGQIDEAISHYEKAINLNNDYTDAYYNLALAFVELNRFEEAISNYKKAIGINPKFTEAYNNLGIALQKLDRNKEAITYYQKALDINPKFISALNNLGSVFHDLGQFKDAISCYKQIISINPNSIEIRNNLGIALRETGDLDEAMLEFQYIIDKKPDYIEAYNNLGITLQNLGKVEDAVSTLKNALNIKPDSADIYYQLCIIEPEQEYIPVVENLLAKPDIAEKDKMLCLYALGKLYDSLKNHDKSFKYYHEANHLKRKTITYSSQENSDYVDRIIKYFSIDYFQANSTSVSNSELPVFILGMPRSGTTLVEQIISSHPMVYGAGELDAVNNIQKEIVNHFDKTSSFPECMTLCEQSFLKDIAEKHLEELKMLSPDAIRITDKMPSNFLLIGLIKTLFPKSKIIHCRRNAMDTCVSIYLNYFAYGNKYSFELVELGKYYLDYERLMTHWNSLFYSEIFEVQYEELIADQLNISKQLIKYLELEWDEQCLDFYKNKREVKTTSNMQVRQPIYNKSVNRWKHYEKHLDPLTNIFK